MGQSQDPLNEDQTTVRILKGIIQILLLSVMENLIIWFILLFCLYPGLVVYKSDDLVNWTPCSTALTTFTGDIWARILCS